MCGLAGVISWDEKLRPTREQLQRMSATIAHRGPDGEGLWISEPRDNKPACGFAHRRLAIIDPDPRANQPFTNHRGLHLIYNGEIYNYRAIKAEIPNDSWRTTCDTEVLLAAYETWAERCVEKFDGMFA